MLKKLVILLIILLLITSIVYATDNTDLSEQFEQIEELEEITTTDNDNLEIIKNLLICIFGINTLIFGFCLSTALFSTIARRV